MIVFYFEKDSVKYCHYKNRYVKIVWVRPPSNKNAAIAPLGLVNTPRTILSIAWYFPFKKIWLKIIFLFNFKNIFFVEEVKNVIYQNPRVREWYERIVYISEKDINTSRGVLVYIFQNMTNIKWRKTLCSAKYSMKIQIYHMRQYRWTFYSCGFKII